MIGTLVTALASFVSTNVDDFFVLTVLFSQAHGPRGVAKIVAGQYVGIGTLVALGIAGAFGAQLLAPHFVGLLGLLPIFLGIRAWIEYRRGDDDDEAPQGIGATSVLGVAAIAISDGGDNIGVYVPVFSGFAPGDFVVILVVFAAMTALWCRLALALANQPLIKEKIKRYQGVLVPVVLVGLGAAILVKSYVL